MTAEQYADAVRPDAVALAMIRDAVEEPYGPVCPALARPEHRHEAEAIIAALRRIKGSAG